MDSVIAAIRNSNTVLVASHVKPDGDAIGSLAAMGILLTRLGKNVTLYNESGVPEMYRFIPTTERVVKTVPETSFDTALLLDCANLERVGTQARQILKIPTFINIDHHAMNPQYGLSFVDPDASSTSEVVLQIAQKFEIPITTDFAMAIYVGILTDTSSFRNANTNMNSFLATVSLLETGISPADIAQKIYESYSLERLRLVQTILENMELFDEDRLWISCLHQEDLAKWGVSTENTLGLIDYGKGLKTVQLAALLEEAEKDSPYRYLVSLRSKDGIDVAAFAKQFNGGGHPKAAGFSTSLSYEEIRAHLIAFVRESARKESRS